jgi:predicted  nucleic acid-binding Zn-ribbon protein
MSPADELSALYQQWRSLSEDEGEAIEAGVWASVEQFQGAKARLQPRIVEISQRLDVATHERQFRKVVEELMQLERRNNGMLQRRRQAADEQMRELDKTGRHLRQLHKSYVPPARTHWQSYS